MFFRQLNRYRKAFDIDEEIEKINQECSKQVNALENESKSLNPSGKPEGKKNSVKTRDIYIERITSLRNLAKQIQIAPEIAAIESVKTVYDIESLGDHLENRIRLYSADRQSLFCSGVALLVSCVSLSLSIIALIVAILLGAGIF